MPHDLLHALEAEPGPFTVDDHGRMLWTSLDHAMTYANVVALARKTRQHVVPVKHLGLTVWWVRKARPRPVCDCYPGGFTPDTYEGPQEHCPVHGSPEVAEPCS